MSPSGLVDLRTNVKGKCIFEKCRHSHHLIKSTDIMKKILFDVKNKCKIHWT